jgi:hypothetical protein
VVRDISKLLKSASGAKRKLLLNAFVLGVEFSKSVPRGAGKRTRAKKSRRKRHS